MMLWGRLSLYVTHHQHQHHAASRRISNRYTMTDGMTGSQERYSYSYSIIYFGATNV